MGFELIIYTINLDAASSSKVFIGVSIECIANLKFELIKLFLFSKTQKRMGQRLRIDIRCYRLKNLLNFYFFIYFKLRSCGRGEIIISLSSFGWIPR